MNGPALYFSKKQLVKYLMIFLFKYYIKNILEKENNFNTSLNGEKIEEHFLFICAEETILLCMCNSLKQAILWRKLYSYTTIWGEITTKYSKWRMYLLCINFFLYFAFLFVETKVWFWCFSLRGVTWFLNVGSIFTFFLWFFDTWKQTL